MIIPSSFRNAFLAIALVALPLVQGHNFWLEITDAEKGEYEITFSEKPFSPEATIGRLKDVIEKSLVVNAVTWEKSDEKYHGERKSVLLEGWKLEDDRIVGSIPQDILQKGPSISGFVDRGPYKEVDADDILFYFSSRQLRKESHGHHGWKHHRSNNGVVKSNLRSNWYHQFSHGKHSGHHGMYGSTKDGEKSHGWYHSHHGMYGSTKDGEKSLGWYHSHHGMNGNTKDGENSLGWYHSHHGMHDGEHSHGWHSGHKKWHGSVHDGGHSTEFSVMMGSCGANVFVGVVGLPEEGGEQTLLDDTIQVCVHKSGDGKLGCEDLKVTTKNGQNMAFGKMDLSALVTASGTLFATSKIFVTKSSSLDDVELEGDVKILKVASSSVNYSPACSETGDGAGSSQEEAWS